MLIHSSLTFWTRLAFLTNNSPETAESINFGKLGHSCHTFTPAILIEHVQKRTKDDYLLKQDISLLMSKEKIYFFFAKPIQKMRKKNLASRNTLKWLYQVFIKSAIHLHDRNIYLTKNCRVQSVCNLASRKRLHYMNITIILHG